MRHLTPFFLLALLALHAFAQPSLNRDYRIALPEHKGQLKWSVDGFKTAEVSAKPAGRELGVRGRNVSGKTFLAFIFLAPETAPLDCAKCRDLALREDKKANAELKVLRSAEIPRPSALPLALITYTTPSASGSLGYRVRGFVASGEVCGDLEFYSEKAISQDDPELKKVFETFDLDPNYSPNFGDIFAYAEVLFRRNDPRSAAPIYEKALASVPPDGKPFPSLVIARRVARDQAGMSYGIAGDNKKARTIFEKGIAEDPDYPMYYYMLACADAGEKKLADAKRHLQQAFERKAHLNPSESLPIPTQDDSFTPYKGNQEFWTFLQSLK